MSRSLVCGVCGGSAAGKSTLVAAVADRLRGRGIGSVVLAVDDYYRDHGHLTVDQRALVNYDHPDSLDLERYVDDLTALAAGRPVEVPVYDFSTHCRLDEVQRAGPQPVVLADGILLLATPEVRRRLDLAVFVEAPEDLRLERRLRRDVEERGRTPESVRRQFAATVVPMYREFVAPYVEHADRIVDGTRDLATQAGELADELAGRLEAG